MASAWEQAGEVSDGNQRRRQLQMSMAVGESLYARHLAPLSEESPRFLSAREKERAEPELVAQAPRADQIPVRYQTPERE